MRRIVLVEDNPGDVFLVREALLAQSKTRGIDWELVCFGDVPEAIEGIRDETAPVPDLILVDLNLPTGEGMDVLRAAKNESRLADVPIAVLTSSDSKIDEQAASAIGVAGYIHKPPGLNEFRDQVGAAISRLLERPAADGPHPADLAGIEGEFPE
jgi:DNA-binding response OmpR family regulator